MTDEERAILHDIFGTCAEDQCDCEDLQVEPTLYPVQPKASG